MVKRFTSSTPAPVPTVTVPTSIPDTGAGEGGTVDNSDKLVQIVLIALVALVTYKFIIKPEVERIKLAEAQEQSNTETDGSK